MKIIGGLSSTIDWRCNWRPIRAFPRWPRPRVPSQCCIQHCFSPSPPLPFHAQIATASRATNFDPRKKLEQLFVGGLLILPTEVPPTRPLHFFVARRRRACCRKTMHVGQSWGMGRVGPWYLVLKLRLVPRSITTHQSGKADPPPPPHPVSGIHASDGISAGVLQPCRAAVRRSRRPCLETDGKCFVEGFVS